MTVSQKQLNHYKNVSQNGLNNFIKATEKTQKDQRHKIIISEWTSFIGDKEKIKLIVENVENTASIFGFGREFSEKMSYEDLVSRVAERFAEIDLAIHEIRELRLPNSTEKLEKLLEKGKTICDFRLKNPPYYFEAKYTKNITVESLKEKANEALAQIRESIAQDGLSGIAVIWIFTYENPSDLSRFQDEIMDIKSELRGDLNLRLNVQTYSTGMYGDATVL